MKDRRRPEVVIDEILMRQVAAIAITGATYKEIADKLNLPRILVRKVVADPRFQEMITKSGENELVPVLVKARARLNKLVDKAINVIEKHLDQDNLNAARMVFEATGLNSEGEKTSDTTIQVILPGQREEKAIEIAPDGSIEIDHD